MNCKICMSNKCKFFLNAKEYNFFKCDKCNYVFINPTPDEYEISMIYQKEYFDKGKYIDDFATKMEYTRRIELIQSIAFDKKLTVLDFGCASGDFVNFAKSYYDVVGVDVSDDAIILAQTKYPDIKSKFVYFSEFPTVDKTFDVIVLWDVIEHVKNPVDTLRYLKTFLATNGSIIISTPNIGAPIAKIFKSKWAFMTPPEHLCFFDKKSVYQFATELEGEVIHWETKGKWVNIAFLFYKIKRIFPSIIPDFFLSFLKKHFNKLSLYVPTGDIQYTIIKFGEV